MSQDKLKVIESLNHVARPEVSVGDTVVVDTVIRDGDKKRIQKFKGIVIAIKGKGTSKTFTVRKISYGIGVEKVFPMHSPNVEAIEIVKHAKTRRSKLYYLRERVGKAATTLKAGKALTEESNFIETVEEVVIEPAEITEEVSVETAE